MEPWRVCRPVVAGTGSHHLDEQGRIEVKSWIRIRIIVKNWIRICIQGMRTRNPDCTCKYNVYGTCTLRTWYILLPYRTGTEVVLKLISFSMCCSYNNNTVNFYLIDPALVAFSIIGMLPLLSLLNMRATFFIFFELFLF
jgi:hypothetical protein